MGYKHYQAQGWPSHRACILLLCKGAHPLQCTLAPMRRPELSMHQPIMWQQPSIVQGQLPCREPVIVSLQSKTQPADLQADTVTSYSSWKDFPGAKGGRRMLQSSRQPPPPSTGSCQPPRYPWLCRWPSGRSAGPPRTGHGAGCGLSWAAASQA